MQKACKITVALLLVGCGSDDSTPGAVTVAAPPTISASPPAPPPAPAAPSTPAPPADAITWTEGTLLFQTGFGGTTALTTLANGNERFSGRDGGLPSSDFDTDIAAFSSQSQTLINYTGGDAAKRKASIVANPADPANNLLRFFLREPYGASEGETKGRVQMDLYGITPGLREFRTSVRAYLHPDFRKLESVPNKIGWLTLAEYWNNEWWVATEPYGFRITVGIGKPSAATQELNLFVEAQDKGQVDIWKVDDHTAKIPIGQWFTLETYYREGNRDTGRFVLAITPDGGARRVLYDVKNFTHNTSDPAPNGLTGYNPVKLYTDPGVINHVRNNGGALQIDWDNMKLWRVR